MQKRKNRKSSNKKPVSSKGVIETMAGGASINAILGSAKGLCRNCENSKKCMYSKTESGVWHCEEYS